MTGKEAAGGAIPPESLHDWLMSDRPLAEVVRGWEGVRRAARRFGAIPDEPFMVLSFLALPVIPELKLTDRGLVDVNRFMHVPLFAG